MSLLEKRMDVDKIPSAIHARLRDGTAELHGAVEQDLEWIFGTELSLYRYGHLLSALHGFYEPLELILGRLDAMRPFLGVPLRARARLLEADLGALGLCPMRDRGSPLPPRFSGLASQAHLAGALYVVEGACLGGQIISREVKRCLALDGTRGISFFFGDGHATRARWARILAWLEEAVQAGLSAGEIVGGARFTFTALSRYLHACGVTV
jgi:heme oxygenase (biliverdin-IX-beta and delta-forming)